MSKQIAIQNILRFRSAALQVTDVKKKLFFTQQADQLSRRWGIIVDERVDIESQWVTEKITRPVYQNQKALTLKFSAVSKKHDRIGLELQYNAK